MDLFALFVVTPNMEPVYPVIKIGSKKKKKFPDLCFSFPKVKKKSNNNIRRYNIKRRPPSQMQIIYLKKA